MSDLPPMTNLKSSNLHSVGHDGTALYVRFRGKDGTPGSLYRYPTAGMEHHAGMIGAGRAMDYFTDKIRHFHAGEKIG